MTPRPPTKAQIREQDRRVFGDDAQLAEYIRDALNFWMEAFYPEREGRAVIDPRYFCPRVIVRPAWRPDWVGAMLVTPQTRQVGVVPPAGAGAFPKDYPNRVLRNNPGWRGKLVASSITMLEARLDVILPEKPASEPFAHITKDNDYDDGSGATTPPAGTHARALIYQGYYPDKTCHQTLVALVLDGDDPAARKTAEAWWDNGEDLGEELDPEDYNADWHPWHEFEGTIDDKCVEGTYRNITEDQVHVRWGPEVLLKVAKMEERMENGAPR